MMRRLLLGVDPQQDLSKAASSADAEWLALDLPHFLHLQAAGMEPTLPDILFDTRVHNETAASIVGSLEAAARECALMLRERGHSPHLNLVSVFFGEILKVLCSAMFMELELDAVLGTDDVVVLKGSDLAASRVQFLTYQQLVGSFGGLQFVGPAHPKTRLRRRIFDAALRMARRLQGDILAERTVLVGANAPHPHRLARATRWTGAQNRIRFRRSPKACEQLWIPDYDRQLHVLKACILQVRAGLQPQRLSTPLGGSELLEMALSRIRPRLTREPGPRIDGDALVVGSLSNIRARIPAAHARSRRIPVVGVWHGDAFGIYDEPVVGVGEAAFADAIVGYGTESDLTDFDAGPWQTELADCRRAVPSSAPRVRKLHTGEPIPRICDIPEPRLLYAPTCLSGTWRYGPYRDMHDLAYLQWQRGLMRAFGCVFEDRITWKLHPNDKMLGPEHHAPLAVPGVRLRQKEPFETLIESVDVFVFDYVSTSFSHAAATSKPIVYFDIGLRNLSHAARAAVLERCVCVPADPRNPEAAFRSFLSRLDRKCRHEFVSRFCLSPDPRSRIEIVADTIVELLEGDSQAGRRSVARVKGGSFGPGPTA